MHIFFLFNKKNKNRRQPQKRDKKGTANAKVNFDLNFFAKFHISIAISFLSVNQLF